MANGRRHKINGVIDKRDLAEIFRRAEGIISTRAAPKGQRQSGRLGKALIKELLSRAVMVEDRPAVARAAADAPPQAKPAPAKRPSPVKPAPAPTLPTPKGKKARELLGRIDDLTNKEEAAPPPKQDKAESLSLLKFLEEKDAAEVGASTERLDVPTDMPTDKVEVVPEPSGIHDSWAGEKPIDSWAAEAPDPLKSDTESFLSLSELTSSLFKATKGHLDDQLAARTMIEDLEMPDAMDDPETQKVLARVVQAEEISFEGYLEDIEELLLETYEHYKNLPQALDSAPVDPTQPDLLGPAGKTLETRRADRKASQTLPALPRSPAPPGAGSRGHLVPSEPIRAPQTPIVPQQPAAQAPRSWQPDPFAVDPYAAEPPTTVGPPNPFASPQAAPGPQVDPFSLNPYTGQSMATQDPFKLDPFNPFGGAPPNAGVAPGPVGPAPGPVGHDPFMNPFGGPPPNVGPGPAAAPPAGNDPFMNPYAAQAPGPGPGAPAPQAFSSGPGAPAPMKDPFASTPGSVGPGTPKPKTNETLGYDPFADPGDSQDPYSWPSRPPQALADAQALADEAAERFDPFGPNASTIPGMEGGPAGSAISAPNPFGPGNMFGAQFPGGQHPPQAAAGGPIYGADSDEFAKPRTLSAGDTKRAFENALVVAGLRGMLEYQRPTPGHGSSHPLLVIYDATTGLFKAPLTPRLSVGDRFQLKDGKIFRVNACRVFEAEGVPCYQEAECKPLGQLNMPLRDSWDEPRPPR